MTICRVWVRSLSIFAVAVLAGTSLSTPGSAQSAPDATAAAQNQDANLAKLGFPPSATPISNTAAAPATAANPTPAPSSAAPVLTPAANNSILPPTAPPSIAPPTGAPSGTTPATARAAEAAAMGSALPDTGGVNARAPGMQLPLEAGVPNGPTGAAQNGGNGAQKSSADIKNEIREDALNAALTGILPLEPSDIRKLLKRYDQTQEAVQTPIFPYPDPEVVVKNVSLDPGVKPVEVKVATGNVTSVNVLDVSGAPWPIQDITWAGNFEVIAPETGGHVVRITPMADFAFGNLVIRLVDLKTPIVFTLRTHRDTMYYRMDARLPIKGPLAKPEIIEGGIGASAGNAVMTAILDGVPPDSVKKVYVSGIDGRTTAYKADKTVYVRTPLTLLSPGWTASVKSADGTVVYALADAPVILLSDQGRMVRAKISDQDQEFTK